MGPLPLLGAEGQARVTVGFGRGRRMSCREMHFALEFIYLEEGGGNGIPIPGRAGLENLHLPVLQGQLPPLSLLSHLQHCSPPNPWWDMAVTPILFHFGGLQPIPMGTPRAAGDLGQALSLPRALPPPFLCLCHD